MGKTIDDLFGLMEQMLQRMDWFEERLNGHEEMLASLIQQSGTNNALWKQTSERLDALETKVDALANQVDHIQSDVNEMKGSLKQLEKNSNFYEKKLLQHEKNLFLMNERLDDLEPAAE